MLNEGTTLEITGIKMSYKQIKDGIRRKSLSKKQKEALRQRRDDDFMIATVKSGADGKVIILVVPEGIECPPIEITLDVIRYYIKQKATSMVLDILR